MPLSVNGANGITFSDGSIQNTGAVGFGFKNRIINGDMRIDQRNGGASLSATDGGYNIDRWSTIINDGAFSIQQNAGSVTPPAGFTNYLGATVTSAAGSITGTTGIRYKIEGYNLADLAWGTASASAVTMSFWVRSSLTGTFGGGMWNASQTLSYPFTYTVNAANTWQYVTITIPGPTSSSWNVTNGVGLGIDFSMGTVAAYRGTAGAWASGFKQGATGQVQIMSTNGATLYITGVQLEKGSTTTAFDYRDYGRELIMCQRYFSKIGGTTSGEPVGTGNIQDAPNSAWVYVKFPTTMRAAPTLAYSQLQIVNNANYALAVSSIRGQYAGLDSANFGVNCSSNGTTFAAVQLQTSATAGYLSMSAEL